eukprot:CAMPEP_0170192972 /NCGR_PEP_ID=MMETSP0040_2-20121228/55708_1 /TAXON_ID=641309 /ORGANISM="Lotharella oceanica, Strain CCMP622" /LENGTH=313 /DNA_ID=CAMNT_0010441471 /DNA_START=46 /DNA_END=984 /DNA_ORIENTATION=+
MQGKSNSTWLNLSKAQSEEKVKTAAEDTSALKSSNKPPAIIARRPPAPISVPKRTSPSVEALGGVSNLIEAANKSSPAAGLFSHSFGAARGSRSPSKNNSPANAIGGPVGMSPSSDGGAAIGSESKATNNGNERRLSLGMFSSSYGGPTVWGSLKATQGKALITPPSSGSSAQMSSGIANGVYSSYLLNHASKSDPSQFLFNKAGAPGSGSTLDKRTEPRLLRSNGAKVPTPVRSRTAPIRDMAPGSAGPTPLASGGGNFESLFSSMRSSVDSKWTKAGTGSSLLPGKVKSFSAFQADGLNGDSTIGHQRSSW